MLLSTINNSIGDKKLHFTIDNLLGLFNKKYNEFTEIEKYAIEIIQTEATNQELNNFKKEFKINSENIKYLLSYKYF
ncbi:hypothetical protein [Arcobacter porcinus]|uniref:hypothetical protein n=1 Tax=Arcobacter porcinus TaxID=1935204 RepID=UPI00081D7B4C|nr:hypothetical protein [Arcobacter porcinus]OCL81814.1 hypothetical protein AAW29_01789 [Arcobacter porcinus]